ncbi:MAG: hypothetical protein P8Y23_15445 [Candidatus Lokiarchaeota archaeon]|jgi:hypothetical protein
MMGKIFLVIILENGIEKYRTWIYETELVFLILELKQKWCCISFYNKEVELKITNYENDVTEAIYYCNISNIQIDELIE